MNAVALMLWPVDHGWEVVTTDGQKLARFTGWGAHWRAERFLSRYLGIVTQRSF